MDSDSQSSCGESPNDPKLSDCVGLAGRVPPGETQENQAEIGNAPDEEARGMTARSSSLQRMVRPLRSNSELGSKDNPIIISESEMDLISLGGRSVKELNTILDFVKHESLQDRDTLNLPPSVPLEVRSLREIFQPSS